MSKVPYIFKVKDFTYIGGSFGRCNERVMMEELYKNGPLLVSFEPDYTFMLYNSGIYHSVEAKSWIDNNIPRPEWEKVDHSVLLVGWGVEKGQKYWTLQNTWGPTWGEGGFFRMKRGSDELGIESMCLSGIPVIEKNILFKDENNSI
jgi:cathepsin C